MTVAIHYMPTRTAEFKVQRKEHCSRLELNPGPLCTKRLTYQCARSPRLSNSYDLRYYVKLIMHYIANANFLLCQTPHRFSNAEFLISMYAIPLNFAILSVDFLPIE